MNTITLNFRPLEFSDLLSSKKVGSYYDNTQSFDLAEYCQAHKLNASLVDYQDVHSVQDAVNNLNDNQTIIVWHDGV